MITQTTLIRVCQAEVSKHVFTSPGDAYAKAKAGIVLVELAEEELRRVRRRHLETIDRHLGVQPQDLLHRQEDAQPIIPPDAAR